MKTSITSMNSFLQFNSNYLLEVKETEQENFNEQFEAEYLFGNKEKAKGYLNVIDVNYQDGYFLAKAVQRGDKEIIAELLQRGANLGLKEALAIAQFYGYQECAELLNTYILQLKSVEKGHKGPISQTQLLSPSSEQVHQSSKRSTHVSGTFLHPTRAATLAERRIEETKQENFNEQFEAEYLFGNKEKAKGYLNVIDVNYQDGYFLAKAVQRGDKEIIAELLQRGANLGLKEALAVAQFYGYKECTELLSKHILELK